MVEPAPVNDPSDAAPILTRTPALPGPFAVGLCHLHAVDPGREDAQDGGPRQFMASAFYPAVPTPADRPARMTDVFEPAVAAAIDLLTAGVGAAAGGAARARLEGSGLRAFRRAEPARGSGPFPTLVYYPGGGLNRFASVDVCQSLASLGYVVVAVDGPHDAPLVVFPDGRLCVGPLRGDYVAPGVGDVLYLLSQLPELARSGPLRGTVSAGNVGLFGHSRGGYVCNVAAFGHASVRAVASIDSLLWGHWSEVGSGLECHPPEFQATVRSTPKPVLRVCGRPAGADPNAEAAFCLARDAGDFAGPVDVVACVGWSHDDFATTRQSCGTGRDFVDESEPRPDAAARLSGVLAAFFGRHLLGGPADALARAVAGDQTLAVATRGCDPRPSPATAAAV